MNPSPGDSTPSDNLLALLPAAVVTLVPANRLAPSAPERSLGADAALTAVNPAAARLLECRTGAQLSLASLCQPGGYDPCPEILGSLARAGAWQGELRLFLPAGNERRVQARFASAGPGAEPFAIGALDESSALFDLRERLEEAERYLSVGRMAGGIAHNLNNAMVAVLGYSSLISETVKSDERLARFVGRIVVASQRCADLIRQFLSFSHKSDLQPVLLSLADVAEIAAKLYIKSDPPGVQLTYDIVPDLPLLYAVPCELQQMLNSLFLFFQDEGQGLKVSIHLTVRLAQPPGDLAAMMGVKQAVLVELSGGAGSGAHASSTQEQGAALTFEGLCARASQGRDVPASFGLPFVREMVVKYHGHLDLSAQAEGGRCFRLYFPTHSALADKTPAQRSPASTGQGPSMQTAPSEGVTQSAAPPKAVTILVIDDEQLVLDLVEDALSAGHFKVIRAGGGREGLIKALATPSIALVLLDRSMPDMDGAEVYDQLRQARKNLPILISTGHNIEDSKADLPEDPRLGFIQKPYRFSELIAAVNQLLEG